MSSRRGGGRAGGGSYRGERGGGRDYGGNNYDYGYGGYDYGYQMDGMGPQDAFERATVYVEGIPNDASEREVSHIFRPFYGFRGLRLVQRDSKRNPGTKYTICFVEFDMKYHAQYALDVLQGYTFNKNDTPDKGLKLAFAHSDTRDRRDRDPPPTGGGGGGGGGSGGRSSERREGGGGGRSRRDREG
eukprot:TRINITY_DN52094_c0_g2_i1.p1 TRINITY_DN52094_c0_g2~~TRINITY_DN52094_c0_g2_i1.p1  ORF type:complete len:187 (-),score=32.12 TRINITY_DN52094_c0_g2_i1:549-1109(-)